MKTNRSLWVRNITLLSAVVIISTGILMRFYNIAESDFVFFDEGYYLNHNRLFAQKITDNFPTNLYDMFRAIYVFIRFSLASGKALWFMIVDSRIFFGGMQAWFFPRVVSAIMGCLTLIVLYLFAKRLFNCKKTALLSIVFLSILPSHVFYSRVGMQEAFSAFLVLLGFYFYIFSKGVHVKTFLSGLMLAGAFFANYRLIILPVLVAFSEVYFSLLMRRKPDFRKYLWFVVTFFSLVFVIGNIDQGQNTIITFAWMFHQAHMARPQFNLVNFISFPYYIFRLEHWLFGIFLFSNIYYCFKKKWMNFFPFFLVCLQMLIFSFAAEKGARYVCVVIPFMVMAVASLIISLLQDQKCSAFRGYLIVLVIITLVSLTVKSFAITQIRSDYRMAMEYLMKKDKNVKVLSTQNWVQNLYTPNKKNVAACPHKLEDLIRLYSQGFRYLIVCPQAFVSYTKDGARFTFPLKYHLGFITSNIKPIKEFSHFNKIMLERFVFEHNENLERSIEFLKNNRNLGMLRIYDLKQCVAAIARFIASQNIKKIPQ